MRALIIVLLLLTTTLKAQFTIESFTGIQTDRSNVLLNWVVSPGNTCADLELQMSADSINYNTVYVYPGICGDATYSQAYQFNHVNDSCTGKRYYRLVSVSGGTFASVTVDFICYGKTGVNVRYNSASHLISVDAYIPPGEQWQFFVYTLAGAQLSSQELTRGTNRILWNPSYSGIYIYTVTSTGRKVDSGQLWISR